MTTISSIRVNPFFDLLELWAVLRQLWFPLSMALAGRTAFFDLQAAPAVKCDSDVYRHKDVI